MGISMLLLCADAPAVSAIDSACKRYEISIEVCLSASEACQAMKQRRFDFLALDIDLPQTAELLKWQAENCRCHPNVVIALSNNSWGPRQAGGEQIHLVVRKPFTASLMERTLRSAYRLLLNQTRAVFRYRVEISAFAAVIERGRKYALPNAVLHDLSSTGLRLKTQSPVSQGSTVFVDFQLPDTGDRIHVVGRIIWTKQLGEAGIQFSSIPAAEFQKLREWLSTRCPWTAELPLRSGEPARGQESHLIQ